MKKKKIHECILEQNGFPSRGSPSPYPLPKGEREVTGKFNAFEWIFTLFILFFPLLLSPSHPAYAQDNSVYSSVAQRYDHTIFFIYYLLKVDNAHATPDQKNKETLIVEAGFFVNSEGLFAVVPITLESQSLLLSPQDRKSYLKDKTLLSTPYNATLLFSEEKTAKMDFVGINPQALVLLFKLKDPQKYSFQPMALNDYTPALGDEFYAMTKSRNSAGEISSILLYRAYVMGIKKKKDASYGTLFNEGGLVLMKKGSGSVVGIGGLDRLDYKSGVYFSFDRLITKTLWDKTMQEPAQKVELDSK